MIMKEIRKRKRVVSVETECDDENNNPKNRNQCSLLFEDDLKRESGFFHLAVRPLLAPGHESELVYFMKSMGLIHQFIKCKNCTKDMKWEPSRSIDAFMWKCWNCKSKLPIREDSPFHEIKCSFKNILLALLSWCNGEIIDNTAEMLDIKKSVIVGLYQLSENTVKKYIESSISKWKIGGPGIIVLVDTFPEGCTSDSRQSNRPILCLAELKLLPPIMWFEALERNPRNQEEITKTNKVKCLEVIQKVIHPESIVVARRDSTLCSYNDLKEIEHKFKTLVSNEGLSRHDSDNQKLLDNLEVIWREALEVCTAAQYFQYSLVQSFLYSYMWRRRFNHESYHYLLNEISGFVE